MESGGDEKSTSPKQYVEYWTRREWRSIEAHADVDEFRAKEEDSSGTYDAVLGPDGYRYPSFGHVLYLQVGSNVKGPTCVWPGRRSGGELLRDVTESSEICNSSNRVELLVVPARAGRLLRFPGSALHAVPRPHDLWLLPFVKGSAKHTPEVEWGRSVILFNVWEDESPLGVSLNEGEGHEGEGAQVDNDVSLDELQCSPSSEWKSLDITDLDDENSDDAVSAKVWLLGNERRRDHPMRTVKVSAPSRLQDALAEGEVVSRVWMDNVF